MSEPDDIPKEELNEKIPEGSEVANVSDKWHLRVLELENGNYIWQCMVCNELGEEEKEAWKDANFGGLGHAKSHDIDKERRKDITVEDVEEETAEISGEGDWRPYDTVKSPTKCLQEVLDEYRDYFKAGFMKLMIKRSKRMEGMHPQEFVDNIITMNSGVSNDKEARLIGEEYRDMLVQEREKAKELNASNVRYPLKSPGDTSDTRTEPVTLGLGAGPDTGGSPRGQGYERERSEGGTGDTAQAGPQTELLKELIRSKDKEVKRMAGAREEKRELQQEIEKEKQKSEIKRLENQVDRLGDKFEKTLDKIGDKIEDSGSDENKLTKEDMELMLEKRDAEHRAEQMGDKMDRVMEKLDSYEERMKELEDERNELQRELYEEKSRSKTDPGDWESDEYRMLSSGVNEFLGLGRDWVRESKKNRRLALNHLLKEGKISEEEAEEMMEDTGKGEAEVLKEYVDEEDVEE